MLTKTLKKIQTFIRNKFFALYNFKEIKKYAPLKLTDVENFFSLLKKNDLNDEVIVSFKDNTKIKCSSADLSAVAETCITEDYQKNKSTMIKPGDVVFDIGAHIGSFSIYAANKGALVYAFEPDLVNYHKLLDNIKLNQLESVIFPFNYGIYSYTGDLSLDIAGHNKGGHSVLTNSGEAKTKIHVKKLNDVISEHRIEKINLLKIDIEGAEYEIFKNLNELEIKTIEKIVGEYHLIPEYENYDFSYLYQVLKPHYQHIHKYWPYNFYAVKS